jgi:hypothetical protein
VAFQDPAEPTSCLKPPEDYNGDVLGQSYASPGMALDWLSPSQWASEFIKSIGGPDIYGEAAQALSGDWEKVYRTGDAFQKMAEAAQAIGVNIASGNLELDAAWDGNAADGAYTYFTKLGAATSAQQLGLWKIGEQYKKAAEGAWRLQETISGILKDITDMCVIAAAEIAAGSALAETGVGLVAGYALAAAETYKILTAIDRAKKLISTALTVMNSIVGEIQAALGDIGNVNKFPLPSEPYRHPATA